MSVAVPVVSKGVCEATGKLFNPRPPTAPSELTLHCDEPSHLASDSVVVVAN